MVMLRIGQRVRRSGANPNLKETTGQSLNYWDLKSVTGASISDEGALSISSFYRGVVLIASTVGGQPIHVHREKADGTSESLSTPDTYYLRRRPNVEMTKQTFWEHEVADEVRGNAFIWVDKDDIASDPIGLWHIDRRRVAVGRKRDGQKVYLVDNELAMIDYKEGGEMVHIPNWGNGLIGYDVVKVAREALALGLSAEEYASRYFSQDAVPPGYLSTQQMLSPDESEEIATRWHQQRGGTKNARRIAVLGGGTTFQTLNVEPEKAQMMELRGFQGEEVARFLGIPPHMLGFTSKVTSWGQGIAEQSRGFVVFTCQAHINRFEQAIDDALLVRELTKRFVKFDTGGLLRGTTLQRYQAYALGYGRWLTPNDIRRDEDLPPLPGGDVLPTPSTLIPIEDLGSNFQEQQRLQSPRQQEDDEEEEE